MRFITTNDLENWANTIDCKYHLPHLLRKLILATIDNNDIKNIQFPYGEDVQTGGFDGELISESENMFVPLGESVWEFGTTNAKGKKANEDYEKRKENTLGKIPSETTYINVSAKKYRDKSKWEEEKQSEGFWKNVKYLDALDIEQWLELAPTVELWLAEKLRKPTLGIYTIEEYWKRWSENESIKIVPEILLGESRSDEIDKIKSFLSDDQKVMYIKSITKDEAIAFPLAIFKQSDNIPKLNIVVIDNRESFNQFIQSEQQLIILAKFKLEGIELQGAVQKGHKIIIPLSLADDVNTSEKIQLPIVSRTAFEEGLKKMGVDSEQIRLLTKNSGRNISVLKRLLKFNDSTKPKYLESIDIRDLIPMLLINRFSENCEGDCEGDIEAIEKLSGKKSDEYFQFLRILAALEDSPVYYINGLWKLVSPTDTWSYFAKYITKHDLECFEEISLDVLTEVLHKYTLPLEKRGNYFQTPENRTKYSLNLREGICESLVIISVFGEDYGINSISSTTSYIRQIVQKILEKDVVVWRSLSSNLMLLAEASPLVFLKNLERIIRDGSISAFFEVVGGLMNNSNDLAPLLWCLDILAWFPEHLLKVSSLLCDLINVSPESFPTTNTPYNSFKGIFRIWYPQTNATVEDRKKILETLIKKYPETLYGILYNLITTKNDTAFHTPRPKWRLFSELREIRVTNREVHFMRGFCLDNVVKMSEGNIQRTAQLINLLDDIEWEGIDKTLEVFEKCTECDEIEKSNVYHKFRKFIGRHRSYPNAHWSLPKGILKKIEETALKFKPTDDILSNEYLLEDYHPEFIEGRKGDDFRKHEEEITSRRVEFVESVINKHGIEKVFELASNVKHPHLYGHTLALSKNLNEKDQFAVYKLVESSEANLILVATDFIRISENKTDLQTQISILDKLKPELSTQGIVRFLTALRPGINLWKLIADLKDDEIEKLYWQSRQGFIYTDDKEELFYGLEKLKHYKKTITFINTLGWGTYQHKSTLTSEEVLTALESLSLEDIEDSNRYDEHKFNNILEFLYSKDDYEIERGANIDMKFILFFTGGGLYGPRPKNLYKLMAKNPNEYFAILSQVYLPDDEENREAELEKIKDNPDYKYIFKAGWDILDNFNLIPSLKEDGTLNAKELNDWINEVRILAKNNHRTEITDVLIGNLLAKYPTNMKEGKGFPIEIYDIIEEINSNELKDSFGTQLYNNLGFTSRGAFEGGNIERSRVSFFNSLYDEIKFSHPNVSLIFKKLSDSFLSQAKWEDDNALLRSFE